MADQMLPRRGQRLSRRVTRPSFAGRGLIERMRTTAFALLGVTTAMALGVVALVSHQGWPYLPVGPIPRYQAEHGRLDNAIALTPAAVGLGISAGEPRLARSTWRMAPAWRLRTSRASQARTGSHPTSPLRIQRRGNRVAPPLPARLPVRPRRVSRRPSCRRRLRSRPLSRRRRALPRRLRRRLCLRRLRSQQPIRTKATPTAGKSRPQRRSQSRPTRCPRLPPPCPRRHRCPRRRRRPHRQCPRPARPMARATVTATPTGTTSSPFGEGRTAI